MGADSNPGRKLRFKAFFSHSYKAEALNVELFDIFKEVAEVQFEVDIGHKSLNVTRLERRIRDCDAFVGVYPYPAEPSCMPTADEAEKHSQYFRLEMELAARARRPSIIFRDQRFQSAIRTLQGFSDHPYKASDVHSTMTERSRAEIRGHFEGFCQRLRRELEGRATGFEVQRRRSKVGWLVPRGPGGYAKAAVAAIEQVAIKAGYRDEDSRVDLGWPPVADARLLDRLDSLDWVFVDVGPKTLASGILGLLQGRFIPAVRMCKGSETPDAEAWARSELGWLFGGLGVGYRKDIVYWRDVESLQTQLASRVEVALKLPDATESIITSDDALHYFRNATGNKQVFFSYSGKDRKIAEQMHAVLRKHYPVVFNYLDEGESLPAGTAWRDKIKRDIGGANFGVLLISPTYKESPHCLWEKDLLLNRHQDSQLPLLPVLLGVQARDMPTGLEPLQPERFRDQDDAEAVALRLVKLMQSSRTLT